MEPETKRPVAGDFVALKIVHEVHGAEARNEVGVLDALASRGGGGGSIIRLFEHFESGGRICMVFELHGTPLYEFVERAPLPLPEAKSVARQMARALHDLQGAGFAHTDLKTENILYRGGEARLIDFSTADRILEKGDDFGTREYRAPELILGGEVSLAVDLWSLGCCIYELISGDYLFDPHGSLWARRKKSGKGHEEWKRLKSAVAARGERAEGAALSPGTIMGEKYRLESVLGRGHFSTVWRAEVLHDAPADGGKACRGEEDGKRVDCGTDAVPGDEEALIDEYDLVLDRELLWLIECALGEYPRARAREGERYDRFFDAHGWARSGRAVEAKSLAEALVVFYGVAPAVAREAEDFLLPLFDYDPAKRPTPAEILEHPWLRD